MSFALTAPGTDESLYEQDGRLRSDAGHFFESLPSNLTAPSEPAMTASTTTAHRIWDLTRPQRRPTLDRFAQDYAAVRSAEQRELTPAQVRALPAVAADHPLAAMWQERAASHTRFQHALGQRAAGSAVDIGAGSGWLAADLARHGWLACALDITVIGGDGLAAARHHHEQLLLLRAEMEALPFASNSLDLAVFNASLHYASDVGEALAEARRVLRPGGTLAVLDSPVFRDPAAGRDMVREFAEHTQQTLGLTPAAHQGPGFVTEHDLEPFHFDRVGASSGLRTQVHRWLGARRAGRETASRPLLMTTKGASR